MSNETTPHYSPAGQTRNLLSLSLMGGLGYLALGRASLSRAQRFLLGAAPGLIGAVALRYFPYTQQRTLDCKVISVTPKGKGFIQQSWLAKLGSRVAFPARLFLYPAYILSYVISEPSDRKNKIVIESPQYRGSKATHLLHGTYREPEQQRDEKACALFFCGNGMIASQMEFAAKEYLTRGIHVMLVDVRGFKNSEGFPSPEGTQLDVQAMVEAANKMGAKKFYFHGLSLGAHHALVGANYAAEQYGAEKIGACIMERPFGELKDAVENIFTQAKGL